MSALDIPGFSALQCVISSLRDTAHFTDEEGDLTDKLRDLRDWVAIRAAVQAAQPEAVSIKVLEIALDRLQYISDFFCDEAGGDDWHLKGVAIDALEEIQRVRASAPTPEPMSAPTADPVAKQPPYAYIYEWDGPFGVHQSTSSARYNGMAPHRSVPVWTTLPSAATEPSDAERYAEQLTRAKRLLVDVWQRHPETRSLIEARTGNWFVWGDNRDAAMRATKGGKL